MGQIHSSSRRASRSNTSEGQLSGAVQPRRNNAASPESSPAPGALQTSQDRTNLAPAPEYASTARADSARSLSQRMHRLSNIPRHRNVGIEDNVNVPSEHGAAPPVTKRRWLRNLRSRPTGVVASSSATAVTAQDLGAATASKQPESVSLPVVESTAAEASTSTASPAAPVQPGPSSAAAALATVAQTAEHAPTVPRVEPIAQSEQTPQPTAAPSSAPSPVVPDASPRGPPAGSLIIVQGIVHAQDTPTAPSASDAASSSPAAPSLRPSSFLPRRASGRSPSRHSFTPSTPSTSPSTAPPSDTDTHPIAQSTNATTPADGNESTQLSQSSIEVLGTLLSFATAATAASLVTGSIDPLFHSGLAPPPDLASAEASQTRRPRSVFGGVRERLRGNRRRDAEDAESSTDDVFAELARAISAAAGRTQQASDAASTAPPSQQPSGSAPVPAPAPAPAQENAEHVLAEPQPGLPQQQSSPAPAAMPVPIPQAASTALPSSASASGALPLPHRQANEDNSFDRFLHNLQADLRTALTEDYARTSNRPSAAPSPSTSNASTPLPPPSTDDSDTSLPANVGLNASTEDAPLHVTPPAPAVNAGQASPEQTRTDDLPAPRNGDINWWRLYRFPPRLMPSGTAVVAVPTDSPVLPTPFSTGASPAAAQDSPASNETGSTDGGSATSTGTLRPRAAAALVVPVIVVGLQSVSPREAAEILPQEVLQEADDLANTVPTQEGTRRREPALARAARALNRLSNIPRRTDSPAPSTESATPTPAPQAGTPPPPRTGRGRTFLIYVIGGYYPLDHSIVTGDLNSFEALWQLSELLGQVKPPVATRAEIDRSGLEVVKAKMLSHYKNEGKVAENTVDRCLVCLDDYQDEDDLRLLSCRHAFHKDCVDKWLEEGKNNCPACRAKGVPTGSDSASESAAALNDTVLEPRT